jgi:hypothetical protein
MVSRDAAGREPARGRPDERGRLDRQALHPGLVAEDRAAGERARWIDRQHGDAMAGRQQLHAELVDEGALAHAGHAGDADPAGAAGLGQHAREQLLRQHAVGGVAALDQGHGLREHGAVRRPDAALVGVDRQAGAAPAHAGVGSLPGSTCSSWSSSATAASAMTVPGPKIAAAPASRSAG